MKSGQAVFITFAVQENVGIVHLGHAGHAFLDHVVQSTVFSALVGGEVGVAARSVPVAQHGFGFVVHVDVELLAHTAQDVLGQPHVVAALDASGDTDLVFPLAGSDFAVDAGDLESGVDHAAVGTFHDVSADGVGGADAAVVLALGLRESVFGESKRAGEVALLLIGHEEFLFDSEPGVFVFGFFHDLVGDGSEVEAGRGDLVVNVGFTEGQESIAVLSERVFHHADGLEPDFGVPGDGLLTGRSVIGPPVEFTQLCDFLGVSSGLAADFLASSVDPDVFDKGMVFG